MDLTDLKKDPGVITPYYPPESQWPAIGRQLFERFASRKLLVAVSTIIALIAADAYTEAAAVALGYLGIQGLKDSRS